MSAILRSAVPNLFVLFLSINAPNVFEFARIDEDTTFSNRRLGLARDRIGLAGSRLELAHDVVI
jgi:hypothetical protein